MNDIYLVPKDELYHYGVKGMKWGVRKNPQKAAAKSAYKTAKREAAKAYRTSVDKTANERYNANSAYNRGYKSKMSLEKNKADFVKADAASLRKFKDAKAAAKRDYKVAIGKDAGKANARYERAKRWNEATEKNTWDSYVKSIVMDKPEVAEGLRKMGTIKMSEIVKANESIRAGLEFENRMKDMEISSLKAENERLRKSRESEW